ncbi:TetR/AcrR family transcriptional regulator [Streptomyces sp. RY43-2]|uniref:TetR/AcrR family transcriptional regulator n=1 Tax=Streptomyces macrolidinus TaxID=2952607 RepID=A0ABT0ZJS9_9ACTN|nr:TetR/AcrR family transcriptional regulator [Streptomyces macrolidinus]MCN9243850.1 TetR/AcrR family transcriptional regulator [Streptomyces macrolidinus]
MAKGQLTPQDWSTAALRAMARGGVAAVSVNALARELGATRGSFYWHFKDRDALLTAALDMWEQNTTTALISELGDITDPRQRLTALFTAALRREGINGLEPAIVAHADHPAVAQVLRRVTERRISYLTDLYADLGLAPAAARHQAVATYAAYLGWHELRHSVCDIVPEVATTGAIATAALEHLITALAGPATHQAEPE